MLPEKVVKVINEQINKELFSAYLYVDMSNYYLNQGLVGFSKWFKFQAKEEQEHAEKFMEYLQDNNVEVKLEAIAKPNVVFADYKTPLVESLKHEQFITNSIYNMMDVAKEGKDYRTQEFLQWFIKEQGEEEKNAEDLILRFDLYGKDVSSLYLLDKDLGSRS